jgi:hypothetical protein
VSDDISNFAVDFDSDSFNPPEKPMLEPPVLNVYLASPLTNNDQETSNDCHLVREITKRVFSNYDYLGIRFNVYDPAEVTPPGSEHTAEEVYLTDHNRTATADLVIFHVNCPSLGVGMEAQIAAGATVPRVVVSRQGAKVSRMFLGISSPTVETIQYGNEAEYETLLSNKVADIVSVAIEKARKRRAVVVELRESGLGRKIFKQRILQQIPISKLADDADIAESFLRRLERDPDLSANVTLMQFNRIMSSINCTASMTSAGIPKLTGSDTALPKCQQQSLDYLIDFVTTQRDWLPDDRIFRVWGEYAAPEREEFEAIRHRAPTNTVITIDEWRERYTSLGLY